MDLINLYEVLVDNIEIEVWDTDGIIFEGKLYDSRKTVEPYEYCRIFQIEVDDHGKLYVGIED